MADVAYEAGFVAEGCGGADAKKTNESSHVADVADFPGNGRDEQPDPTDDHSCRQCAGTLDGTERPHVIGGQTIWLHPECARFFVAASNSDGLEFEPGRKLDS